MLDADATAANCEPISPAGRLPAEQNPARPASADAREPLPPSDPPAPQSSVDPIGGGSRLPRRSRPSARAPQPGSPGGHLEDLASGWPPASARVQSPDTRLDTVSADPFLLRTPSSGWPADGHDRPFDRPVGRTSPVQGNRSTRHAMANQKRPGQGTDERHRRLRLSSIATTTTRLAGTRRTPAVGPAFAAWQTKAGSAMATLPARPYPRQRPGSHLVSLHRPSGALAHCCPWTISGRA